MITNLIEIRKLVDGNSKEELQKYRNEVCPIAIDKIKVIQRYSTFQKMEIFEKLGRDYTYYVHNERINEEGELDILLQYEMDKEMLERDKKLTELLK